MRHSRFTQLLIAGVISSVAIATLAGSGAGARPDSAAAIGPGDGVLLLFMNTAYVGRIQHLDGCSSTANVVNLGPGDQGLDSRLQVAPCSIRHGVIGPALQAFIGKQLDGATSSKTSIEIAVADPASLQILSEVVITHAVLTRFQVPAADAGTRDPVYFTTTITGESILPVNKFDVSVPPSLGKARGLFPNAFTFRLAETLQPFVRTVSSVTFRRDGGLKPGPWTYSNLSVTTGFGNRAGSFPGWYGDSVLAGPVTEERGAQLQFLTADLAAPLATVSLPAVGVFAADDGLDTGGRSWSMYVDAATIAFN
jgi:hypothetical protein